MRKLRFLPQAWRRNERGQILVLLALLMTGIMGFTATAVDIGSLTSDKRDLQNVADAMALAAAQDLPSQSATVNSAETWASKNGIEDGDGDLLNGEIDSIQVIQQSLPNEPNPKVTVVVKRRHEFTFARVLGIESKDIEVRASAIKTSLGGRSGIVPWSVLQSVKDEADPGDEVILKYDSKKAENGNFGALAIDGRGASTYRDTVKYGSDSIVCSEAAVAAGCQETAPECDGAVCYSEPGNMTGPTRTGVDYRIDNSDDDCDEFDEVFPSNGDGSFSITQQCNPFIQQHKPSLRVIIIPVIDDLDNGRDEVTIKEFALFFLEGYDNGKCSGNSCEIKGRFVRADITVGGLVGVYDPDSLMHFVRLTQ